MDGFFVKRTIGGEEFYYPADEKTKKRLAAIAEGQVDTVTIHDEKHRRDPVKHNQFFAIVDKCIMSIDHESKCYHVENGKDLEMARDIFLLWLKKQVGFYVYRSAFNPITRKAEETAYPDSLNFDDCPEAKAEAFRNAAYGIMAQLFNCTRGDLFDGTFGRY